MEKNEMLTIAVKDYNDITSILKKVWDKYNNSIKKFAKIFDMDANGGHNPKYDLYSCDVEFIDAKSIIFSFMFNHLLIDGKIKDGILIFDKEVMFNPFEPDCDLFYINFVTNKIKPC